MEKAIKSRAAKCFKSEEATSDESVNPNPNEMGSEDTISDDTVNPNPNDTGEDETKADDVTNPNSNDTESEGSRPDETAVDEEDEDHALRALHRVKKIIPAAKECVEQTLDNGQVECISVE